MRISARVSHAGSDHRVTVSTGAVSRSIGIPANEAGAGSSVNGGEFLMLALATCYCNDVYREAARAGIPIRAVEVEAQADFDGIGLAARDIRYRAIVDSPADPAVIEALLRETDAVAEVQNTVRAGVPVQWRPWAAPDA